MKQKDTICYKHDKILELAKEISSGKLILEECISNADDIYGYYQSAKEDGQKMENGLNEKKDRLEKLEERIQELENNN